MPFKWFKVSLKTGSGHQPQKEISLENGLIKVYCVWSNMVTVNKTHATILVCAAGVFR